MTNEIWKDIPGFEGIYQASNIGQIKSLERIRNGGGSISKCRIKERILKPRKNKVGYLHLMICNNGKRSTHSIHRLVAIAFLPNYLNKPTVNHKNGNKLDNRVENLEWATFSENTNHGFENGLNKRGELHFLTNLTKSDVLEIRRLSSIGEKQRVIGDKFGISLKAVSDIVRRKNWKHN